MPKLCLLANAASPHTEKWAYELARRGWEVHIISFIPAQIANVKVHVVPKLLGGKLDVILRRGWVVRQVRRLKPDIVHAHYATSFGFLGVLAQRRPLVISAWGSDIFSFPHTSLFHKMFLEWTLEQADVLCSTSRIMAIEMRSYIKPERRIEVIPFGVDTGLFSPPPEKPEKLDTPDKPVTPKPVVFGVAKNLHPVYGLDILFKAFAELEHIAPRKARIRIAGDGPERGYLQKLASRLEIAQYIEWVGDIPNQKVAEFYQELDVVVVPSRRESFGVTAVEGSACGKPIIASQVGGLSEVVIDGKTGILVQSENVTELKEAMLRLINNPEERASMGQAGREFVVTHYNWQENVSQMEKVYRGLLGR